MSAIGRWISSFGGMISAIGDFLLGMLEDLWFVVSSLFDFTYYIPGLFDWLPANAVLLIVLTFVVVVIYKILGREG